MKRIALTGGGSGGHIYPLLAVAEYLKGNELRYFGPRDEWSVLIEKAGIPVSGIVKAKLRRYASFHNILLAITLPLSVVQALIKIMLFRPHVAFSKGGPGALPVLFACKLYGVPIVIHESDAVPGITSRITGKWARIVETAWEESKIYFPHNDVRRVGVPLRADLAATHISKDEAKKIMECGENLPILLVLGGSQGSERINNFILENLNTLLTHYQIIHQTGTTNHNNYIKRYNAIQASLPPELTKHYHPHAYLEKNIKAAYIAADCAMSRSGSVVFELAAFGVPALLIPLPNSANGHQVANAQAYVAQGAGIAIEENDLHITPVIEALRAITNPENHAAMTSKGYAMTQKNAGSKISEDILSL
jgi:UDP-N-acetylglucosamine--N-acetylmuramyl-(pentapeptide) pyrophosphoryl-undecaprenol N-acetylglucosamine transferase